jgi:hypothetical protein
MRVRAPLWKHTDVSICRAEYFGSHMLFRGMLQRCRRHRRGRSVRCRILAGFGLFTRSRRIVRTAISHRRDEKRAAPAQPGRLPACLGLRRSPLLGYLGNDFLGYQMRHGFVMRELHRVGGAAARHAAQLSDITEHF